MRMWTSEKPDKAKFRTGAILPILPSGLHSCLLILLALFIFEPVFVLLAVGHGGALERLSLFQLLLIPCRGIFQVGTAEVSIAQVSAAQVGTFQDLSGLARLCADVWRLPGEPPSSLRL